MQGSMLRLCVIILTASGILCGPLGSVLDSRSDTACSPPRLNEIGSQYKDNEGPHTNNGTDQYSDWELASSQGGPLEISPGTDSLTARRLKRRAFDWDTAVTKGKALWERLQAVVKDPNAQDIEDCGIDQRWDLKSSGPTPLMLSESAYRTLPSNAVPFRQFEAEFYFTSSTPRVQGASFRYVNGHSPRYGVICAYEIRGVVYTDSGSPRRAPDRWSDVTYQTWRSTCATHGVNPNALQWIVQDHITNDVTANIIDKAIESAAFLERPDRPQARESFEPGDDEFFALLSTPNVVGSVYMLMHYVVSLGRKSIKEIGVYRIGPQGDYYLYLELEAQQPATQQLPGLETS